LSQHLFDLQFARYMHNSAQGNFASDDETEDSILINLCITTNTRTSGNTQRKFINLESLKSRSAQNPPPGSILEAPSELAQIGEVMKEMRDRMSKSGDVLDNINRTLMLIKREQSTVFCPADKNFYILKDPLNQQHVAASECGLPPLCCSYTIGFGYGITLSSDHIARYLKFFNIGAELLQDGEVPRLIDGKESEAGKLLLKQAGVGQY
ncbi:unnamed protein product, partial [Rhizoctonia solani]